MKKTFKNTAGITLIALVVTIVVLLILAGVSVNALFGDSGIIEKAKDAQNKMNLAIENDQKGINELSKWLDNQVNRTTGGDDPVTPTGNWTQNKTSVTNGTTTYTVGDDYTYDCGVSGYTGVWKVLGAENGKLLIMSTVDVGTLQLSGKDGYNTGVSKLNEMCAPYGKNARSIKVEDINRVTGYDPTNQGDGTVYCAGQFTEYGNKVTYTASGSSATNGQNYTGSISYYEHPDGKKIGTDNVTSITVESTSYYYYPYSLTTSSSTTGECKGIATDSSAYKLLFRNADDSANCCYWLASSYVGAGSSNSDFGLRYVYPYGHVYIYSLWRSRGGFADDPLLGVRAVVPVD